MMQLNADDSSSADLYPSQFPMFLESQLIAGKVLKHYFVTEFNLFYSHFNYPCLQRYWFVGILQVLLKLNMSAEPSRKLFLSFYQHLNLLVQAKMNKKLQHI